MQSTLPKVCDTKLMASTTPFREEIRNSSLETLLMTVKSDPYTIPEMVQDKIEGLAGYSLGETNEKYHEAGYYAFVTGLCFIAMSNRLHSQVINEWYKVKGVKYLTINFIEELHKKGGIQYFNIAPSVTKNLVITFILRLFAYTFESTFTLFEAGFCNVSWIEFINFQFQTWPDSKLLSDQRNARLSNGASILQQTFPGEYKTHGKIAYVTHSLRRVIVGSQAMDLHQKT